MRNKARTARYLIDRDYDIYIEGHFHEIICSERKRTERSGRPFLLALLNIEQILKNRDSDKAIKKIAASLSSCARETDPKGWYSHNDVIGVIFTEIAADEEGRDITGKIYEGLLGALPPELVNRIGISFHLFPESCGRRGTPDGINPVFYPDIANGGAFEGISRALKRVMDVVVSILALIIFSPLFLVIPPLIKLSSKGPALFRQERYGHLGEKFTFLKFRTMYVDCGTALHREYVRKLIREQRCYSEENGSKGGERVYKIKNDPRVTPLGRILRKTSLDELPQFINVLKGDMSLVGPRPPIPYELSYYDSWHKRRVLEAKPGITGLWQITGRSKTTFDEMVRLDLAYIRNYSLWMDIKILLRTPLVVILGRGSY